ncbi:protein ROOT HAIR DEFECTIVE 3 1 [Carex littledalei]|uniref:Protein ROOT HAIR DEFECTIVE 3 1 n=1 Tax=Carex littledalei TaxID=544730 RepID=A0A833VWZ0_9POAL|nr:protein ROOT HAIR DEFECTIVE 3 1 [Carex littledalei]
MNIQMVGSDEVLLEDMVMDLEDRLPADEKLTVVSIIGRQNTGKSFLLNSLFGTDFNVLDPQENHGQTTRGIWIAQCPTNPSIVVIDIEGSDSSTNAQNGTSFANRAALFALTISDVLLLNMEARGLGQYEGGSLPLLQTIFRERISLSRRKTRVEVTLRDCRNLTNEIDRERAEEIINECWNSSPATNGRLEDYIEVSVVRFPNATDSGQPIQNEFQSKVAQLREKLTRLTPTQSRDTFLDNVRTIWPAIRSNKNLNIPSFNKMLSAHRCDTIMKEELSSLDSNEGFSQLRDMEDTTSSVSFQRTLAEFLTSTLERFDERADGSIPEVRDGFRARLQREIINKLEENFSSILWTETSKKVEEKKKLISRDLRAMKKGIVSSIFTLTSNLEAFESNIDVDSIVNPHVREFEQLFGDCREEYRKFVPFCRAKVDTLKYYAEREIMEIERNHKYGQYSFVSIGMGLVVAIGAIGKSMRG